MAYPNLSDEQQRSTPAKPQQNVVKNQPASNNGRSSGGGSAFSGTTVRISPSRYETLSLNTKDIVVSLRDLSESSDRILALIIPQEASDKTIGQLQPALPDPKSRQSRELDLVTSNFRTQQEHFGNGRFIDIPPIVGALFSASTYDEIPFGPWRIDPLLHKANLVILIRALLIQQSEMSPLLIEDLENLFPRAFLQQFLDQEFLKTSADGSSLLEETFEILLDIRTQYFVMLAERLAAGPNFDPESLLEQTFLQDSAAIKGWDVPALRTADLSESFKKAVEMRLIALQTSFSRGAPHSSLLLIKSNFTFEQLAQRLLTWSKLRLEEISTQVEAAGGVNAIMEALEITIKDGFVDPTGPGAEEQVLSPVDPRQLRSSFQVPLGKPKLQEGKFTYATWI